MYTRGSLVFTGDHNGRVSTTEQSLGGNVAELVDWAYVAPMKLATNE